MAGGEGDPLSMLAQQAAVAGDRCRNPGEPQQVPQRGLGRGHDRFLDPGFQGVDDRVRTEIEAGDDQPVARRVPPAEGEIEYRLALGRAHAGIGMRAKCPVPPSGPTWGYQASPTMLTLGTMTPSRTSAVIASLPCFSIKR